MADLFPADYQTLGSENVFNELLFIALRMFEIDAQTKIVQLPGRCAENASS